MRGGSVRRRRRAGVDRSDALIISCVTTDGPRRSLGARVEAERGAPSRCADQRRPGPAADGALTLLTSGREAAMKPAEPDFDAIAQGVSPGRRSRRGLRLQDDQPALAGVYIAAACEAIAFAKKLGLDLSKVYEVITASAGNSWMFENRVPQFSTTITRRRAPWLSSPRTLESYRTWPALRLSDAARRLGTADVSHDRRVGYGARRRCVRRATLCKDRRLRASCWRNRSRRRQFRDTRWRAAVARLRRAHSYSATSKGGGS